MQRTTIGLVLLTSSFALFAGCASAPGKPANPQPEASTGPTITLHAASRRITADVDLPSPSGSGSAIDYVNARRAEVGLPAITVDSDVAAAAADHAHYLEINDARGHDEVAGSPGFTGVDVTSRVRLHTKVYGASEVLSVYGGRSAPGSPIEEIFASPYHRGAIFFDWARAGEAVAAGRNDVTVLDFADLAPALKDTELVAYPYDGQQDAPTSWTDNEQPDPMGGPGYAGQTLGFPITLSGGPSAHIVLQTVELRDVRGKKVRCHIAALTAADAARNTAICTPYEPLKTGVRYTVHATGRLTQRDFRNAPFDLQWSFTTLAPGLRAADAKAKAARS